MNNPLYNVVDNLTDHTTPKAYAKGYREFLTPALLDAGIDVTVEDPTEILNHHMNQDPGSRQSRLARVWSLCWLIEFENNADRTAMMMFELGLAAAVLGAAHHIPSIETGSKVRKAGEAAREQHNRERSYQVNTRRKIVAKILRDTRPPRDPITNRKISLRKHVIKILAQNYGFHDVSEYTVRDDIAAIKKIASNWTGLHSDCPIRLASCCSDATEGQSKMIDTEALKKSISKAAAEAVRAEIVRADMTALRTQTLNSILSKEILEFPEDVSTILKLGKTATFALPKEDPTFPPRMTVGRRNFIETADLVAWLRSKRTVQAD